MNYGWYWRDCTNTCEIFQHFNVNWFETWNYCQQINIWICKCKLKEKWNIIILWIGNWQMILPVCTRSSQSRPAKWGFKHSIKIDFACFIYSLSLYVIFVSHSTCINVVSKRDGTHRRMKTKYYLWKLTSNLNKVEIIDSTFHCQIVQCEIDNGWNSRRSIGYFLMPSHIGIGHTVY